MRRMGVTALPAVLCGCATIVKGTPQTVAVDTPGVTGAMCELSSPAIGTQTVTSPGTIVLEKSQHSISVVCRKRCYQDGAGVIASNTEGMAAGNAVLGGVVGLGVDAMTGAMNKYAGRTSITMIPIQGCRV